MLTRALSLGLLALAACGGSDPQVHVSRLPDFDRRPMKVSVVGVFEDGLLRADEWTDLGPTLATPLGGGGCDAFYSQILDTDHPALASAIDHVTRVTGVTDALLSALAPAAKGDVILLVSKGAHPPGTTKTVAAPRQYAGMNQHLRNQPRDAPREIETEGSIDLSASFFSLRDRRLVAQLEVSYPGDAVAEASRRFADELLRRFPSMTCAGWDRDAKIDETTIEAMVPTDPPP